MIFKEYPLQGLQQQFINLPVDAEILDVVAKGNNRIVLIVAQTSMTVLSKRKIVITAVDTLVVDYKKYIGKLLQGDNLIIFYEAI